MRHVDPGGKVFAMRAGGPRCGRVKMCALAQEENGKPCPVRAEVFAELLQMPQDLERSPRGPRGFVLK